MPEAPDDDDVELLLEEFDDGADELELELELLLEPQAPKANDASATSAPMVMRRCLNFISLIAVDESVESLEGPDVKRA